MALETKHRSSIYRTFAPLLGEEETEALLSQFPTREIDEPITRDYLRAELAVVRAEIHQAINRSIAVQASITAVIVGVASALVALLG